MNTLVQRAICALLGTCLALVSLSGHARTPGKLDDIQRETRIVADVFRAALRDQLKGELRVTDLHAEYLAQQGVLVSVTLNRPWLKIDDAGHPSLEFHGNIAWPEIPAMVENILHDLHIDIAPYAPEDLEALRDLREEQRELRMEARELRARLRDERRALVREEDPDHRLAFEDSIQRLEEELRVTDAQYEEMSREIEAHYQGLRDPAGAVTTVEPPPPPEVPNDGAAPSPAVDAVIAATACDYGATLKSLGGDDFLTFALRRGKQTQYFAFSMGHISECSRRNMSPSRLLELAWRYEA